MNMYRVAERGVIDMDTGRLIQPHMQTWRDYERWLAAGNELLAPLVVDQPPPTQAIIDALAELEARKAMRKALHADSVVQYLRTHTPAEVASYVAANVTDLASARNVLAKLAMIVAYLARERLQPEPAPPADKPMP